MGYIGVVLTIAGAALAVSGITTAADTGTGSGLIIGGNTSHIDDANFMVQVFWVDVKTLGVTICGGTLLSDLHVLTAGHCVPDENTRLTAAAFDIIYGASEFVGRGKNGMSTPAAAFQRHPKYGTTKDGKNEGANYDVAVIRLKAPIKLGPKAGTIKITAPNAEPKPGSALAVSGWGVYKLTSKGGIMPRKLHVGSYKVLPRATCLKAFGSKLFTKESICVDATPKSAYCAGDSGGPGYQGNVQYSVVSVGSCGQGQPPYGIMASLADEEVNKFIQDQLKIRQ